MMLMVLLMHAVVAADAVVAVGVLELVARM